MDISLNIDSLMAPCMLYTVMCLAFDEEKLSGVCGSPNRSLEVFAVSQEEVCEAVIIFSRLTLLFPCGVMYRVCLRRGTVWS